MKAELGSPMNPRPIKFTRAELIGLKGMFAIIVIFVFSFLAAGMSIGHERVFYFFINLFGYTSLPAVISICYILFIMPFTGGHRAS